MESIQERQQYNDQVAALRAQEYPMIESTTYLDHAGTTLPSRSLIEAFATETLSTMISNPHSASSSSRATAQAIDDIRVRVLRFFGADPDHFDVVFVSNATAGIKLVAEAFRDGPRGFCYGYHKDAHTSVVGVRELAVHGSRCFESDAAVERWLDSDAQLSRANCPTLFAYPGQSNMNGRRLPLDWCSRLRQFNQKDTYSLLDAAALAATASLNLSDPDQAPDFTAVSFYKIFGFPDLGALIVRNLAAKIFEHRRYFGGGTVDVVSSLEEQWHISKSDALHSRIEDGTLPLRNIMAVRCAIVAHEKMFVNQVQVSKHTAFLAKILYGRMRDLKHGSGHPVFKIYADASCTYDSSLTQGPILAFNICDGSGNYHSCYELSKLATLKGIELRIGTLCNPGGVAEALNTSAQDLRDSFDAGVRCGSEGDVRNGRPMAMARASLGAPSTLQDIDNFMNFIQEFFAERTPRELQIPHPRDSAAKYYVEAVTIYPIKSCGGWPVPPGNDWPIWKEGLAWDRQWSLLHQGTKVQLNQKRCPKMTLMRPSIDFSANLLRIRFVGAPDLSVPNAISISLGAIKTELSSTLIKDAPLSKPWPASDALIYYDPTITEFFTTHLGIPCYLARVATSTASKGGSNMRELTESRSEQLPTSPTNLSLPGSFPTPPPSPPPAPRTFSNDSPILAISRTSVDRINLFREREVSQADDKTSRPMAIEPTAFRANILLAARQGSGDDWPFEEETWSKLRISRPLPQHEEAELVAELDVSGRCQRCQMICINQQSGDRRPDSFTALAKLRQGEKGVSFGVHCRLAAKYGEGGRPEPCIRVGDWVDGIPAQTSHP